MTGVAFDVIDCDDDDAAVAVQDLLGGTLPDGPIVRTGRGWHLYVAPTGEGNRVGVLSKVDFRGVGGFVVAPPSIHPDGGNYEWEVRPEDASLRPLPGPLAALLRRPDDVHVNVTAPMTVIAAAMTTSYGRTALHNACQQIGTAVEGERNHTLNRATYSIGRLIAGAEVVEAEAVTALTTAALKAGLGERETKRTIESGIEAGKKLPRTAPGFEAKPKVASGAEVSASRAASAPGDVALLEVAHAHAGLFRSLPPQAPKLPLEVSWESGDGVHRIEITGPRLLGVVDQSVFLAVLALVGDEARRSNASASTSAGLSPGPIASSRQPVEVVTSLREIARLIGAGTGADDLRRIKDSLNRLRQVLVSWVEEDETGSHWVSSALLAHGTLSRDGALVVGVDPLLSDAACRSAARVRIELGELRTLTAETGPGRHAGRILLPRMAALVPPGGQRSFRMSMLAEMVYGPAEQGHSRERVAQVAAGAALTLIIHGAH